MDFQPVRLVKGRSTRLPACLVGARAFPLTKFRRWAARCHLAEPFLPDVGTSRDGMLALGVGVYRAMKSTRISEENNCISTVFVAMSEPGVQLSRHCVELGGLMVSRSRQR